MKSKKSIILLVSLILLIGATVVGTVALLTTSDGPLKNIFNPSKVTTSVEETLDGRTKSNVTIKNTGDTEAYIRAAVVITWQDAAGNVYGKLPEAGKDYQLDYAVNSTSSKNRWVYAADGFWYHTGAVPAGEVTDVLIKNCKYLANAPDGYYLNVEIIGSGIQSKPAHVVMEEWKSGVASVSDDGTLSIE